MVAGLGWAGLEETSCRLTHTSFSAARNESTNVSHFFVTLDVGLLLVTAISVHDEFDLPETNETNWVMD